MKNVCQGLQDASAYVRTWLSKQPNVKEESLTDWLLFEVSNRIHNIKYAAFTRHEEARTTGADWEWWIVYSEFSYRFRVQAKKAFPGVDNYPSLAHTNRYGLQIEKLLSDAKIANAIAMYAFFSAEQAASMCGGKPGNNRDGVFLAGATKVLSTFMSGPRKPVDSEEMLMLANPFSCFACCPIALGEIQPLKSYLRHYYSEEVEGASNNEIGVHSNLPAYVSSILEHESQPSWWDREFKSQASEFNSLLIYDFREKKSAKEAQRQEALGAKEWLI